MRVRCVNNIDWENNITIGRTYPVVSSDSVSYKILDDTGENKRYFKSRFTTLHDNEDVTIGAFFEPTQKPTTLFEVIDGESVPIPETLQPLNGDYIVFKGVKYQIVSLTHDVDQGVKIYKMEIVKCK